MAPCDSENAVVDTEKAAITSKWELFLETNGSHHVPGSQIQTPKRHIPTW